jgi:hypothetical protein
VLQPAYDFEVCMILKKKNDYISKLLPYWGTGLQLASPSSPGPVNKYELQNFIRKLQGICMESLTDGKYIFCF